MVTCDDISFTAPVFAVEPKYKKQTAILIRVPG